MKVKSYFEDIDHLIAIIIESATVKHNSLTDNPYSLLLISGLNQSLQEEAG